MIVSIFPKGYSQDQWYLMMTAIFYPANAIINEMQFD